MFAWSDAPTFGSSSMMRVCPVGLESFPVPICGGENYMKASSNRARISRYCSTPFAVSELRGTALITP
jgi:hypothetical protein